MDNQSRTQAADVLATALSDFVKAFSGSEFAENNSENATETQCPAPTQDIGLNLKNRKNAIDTAMYGPLNPAEPNEEYWAEIGAEWRVDVETAKQQRCGNCAVFIQTPEMLSCIETGLTDNADEFDSINEAGELGYCEAFDFKCASARTCRAWVAGGPVTASAIDIIDEIEPLVAAKGPCWDGYKQVGMKKGKDGKMVPNCVPVDAADDSEFATKKRTISQTPAPKKDQVKGSDKNKKGSADGKGKINFNDKTEASIKKKVEDYNKTAPKGRKATVSMLKAVYRRGAGAFSVSHRPGMNRNQWAMARVNAFLTLLKSGKPSNSAYTTDNDLLPASHPRSSKKKASALTASGLIPEEQALAEALLYITQKYGKFDQDGDGVWAGYTPAAENDVADIGVVCKNCIFYSEDEEGNDVCQIISIPIEDLGKCRFAVIPEGVVKGYDIPVRNEENLELLLASFYADQELNVELKDQDEYESSEQAIVAMAEYSGLGYEAETAFRAAWLRAVRDGENPFDRAALLAKTTYESKDSDLLPTYEKGI